MVGDLAAGPGRGWRGSGRRLDNLDLEAEDTRPVETFQLRPFGALTADRRVQRRVGPPLARGYLRLVCRTAASRDRDGLRRLVQGRPPAAARLAAARAGRARPAGRRAGRARAG